MRQAIKSDFNLNYNFLARACQDPRNLPLLLIFAVSFGAFRYNHNKITENKKLSTQEFYEKEARHGYVERGMYSSAATVSSAFAMCMYNYSPAEGLPLIISGVSLALLLLPLIYYKGPSIFKTSGSNPENEQQSTSNAQGEGDNSEALMKKARG